MRPQDKFAPPGELSEASLMVSAGLAHRRADTRATLPAEPIGEILRRNAKQFGARPAVWVARGDAVASILSYGELLAQAENVARWLAARCQPGERVALWSRNSVESILLLYGSALAGTIYVPFNTSWADAEVAHALALARPAIVFAGLSNSGLDLAPRAQALSPCPVHRLEEINAIGRAQSEQDLPPVAQSDPFLIQFTSGTTGKAKGAVISHRAGLMGGWLRQHAEGVDENDIWLNAVPFHHVGGSCTIVLGALLAAASFTVIERYDRDQIVALMRVIRPTRMGGVPTMWLDILAADDLPPENGIKMVSLGGASVPAELVRRVHSQLGAKVSIGYGQSEFTAATATMRDDPPELHAETVGRPLPHIEMKIVDLVTNAVLRFGETGEICVRGPAMMDGYWDSPEATAATIDAQGFLHTGDLGAMDENGYVRINGRSREVIIRGGENIYPPEIEAALISHPAVALAAVVGVDHARLGQEPGAIVQLHPGAAVEAEALEAHVGGLLAKFKIPRHWRFVDAMPLTASGKIRKVELEGLFKQSS